MRTRYLSSIIMLCFVTILSGQPLRSDRFEERTFSLGGGYTSLLDTYLSPLHYGGGQVALQSERFGQLTCENGRWFAQSLFTLHADYTTPRTGSGLTIGGMADYSYTYYYRPLHTNGWSLYVGPQGQLRIGGIYNLRNSNNPAQLKLGVNLAASAMGKYAFTLWSTPMSVRLQADVPLFGFAFAPDYGQSYYEIFSRGNYDNNAVATTFISAPNIRQQLMLDVNLGKKLTMRVGYLGDYQQAKVNNLKQHVYSHRLMIGITKTFRMINYR